MAITLKLKHTFSTRVVYQTAEVEEVRKALEASVGVLRLRITKLKEPKDKALCQVGIDMATKALAMEDEAMVLFLTREAFKCGFKDTVKGELKDLNVTKMGPIHTQVVS